MPLSESHCSRLRSESGWLIAWDRCKGGGGCTRIPEQERGRDPGLQEQQPSRLRLLRQPFPPVGSPASSLVAQTVKNPPAMRETCVRSLGWEGPLEKGMPTHSSVLAWRTPWTVQFRGCKESDTTEQLSLTHSLTTLSRLPRWLRGKEPARQCRSCRRLRLNHESGRPAGEGNGNPLQHSCLGNAMDRGAWWATAHGVARNWTQLSE